MPMRKYQSVESSRVESLEAHKAIESNLHKLGKTSAVDLSEAERKSSLDTQRSE